MSDLQLLCKIKKQIAVLHMYITADRHDIVNTSQPRFTWTMVYTPQDHTHHHSITHLMTGA